MSVVFYVVYICCFLLTIYECVETRFEWESVNNGVNKFVACCLVVFLKRQIVMKILCLLCNQFLFLTKVIVGCYDVAYWPIT